MDERRMHDAATGESYVVNKAGEAYEKPQPPFLKTLFSVVTDMSAVQRFSRVRMAHPEHVLAHTGMVCVFAYAIGRKLQALRPANDPEYLDMGKVMCRAVVHDMDETITGDIVRPTKYYSAAIRKELAGLESVGINNISTALGLHVLTADWMKAKDGREGYIVKLADLLAAVCTVWVEVKVHGNLAMVQPASNMLEVVMRLKTPDEFKPREYQMLSAVRAEAGGLLGEVANHASPMTSVHGAL